MNSSTKKLSSKPTTKRGDRIVFESEIDEIVQQVNGLHLHDHDLHNDGSVLKEKALYGDELSRNNSPGQVEDVSGTELPSEEFEKDLYRCLEECLNSRREYSKKVFVGGLPAGIGAADVKQFFSRFGQLSIDWPHREPRVAVGKIGYAFLLFSNSESVADLLNECDNSNGRYSIRFQNTDGSVDKMVPISRWMRKDRLWLKEGLHVRNVDTRLSVFVGGLPRNTTAADLAAFLAKNVGDVQMVLIQVEFDSDYPRGAARVVFSQKDAYMGAVATRYIDFMPKMPFRKFQLEMKPFLEDCMCCEECSQADTRLFCANLDCLRYLCGPCWQKTHTYADGHRPMQKGQGKRVATKSHQRVGDNAPPLVGSQLNLTAVPSFLTENTENTAVGTAAQFDSTKSTVVRPVDSTVVRPVACGYQNNKILPPVPAGCENPFHLLRFTSEGYSPKLFVGRLPEGISAAELCNFFGLFGDAVISWPKSHRSPNQPSGGFVFVVFSSALSVNAVLSCCTLAAGKCLLSLPGHSSHTSKMIEVRAWRLSDRIWYSASLDVSQPRPLALRYSIFLGGLPRTSTAYEVASVFSSMIGGVVLVQIETDLDCEYPRGTARVVFNSRDAYVKAVMRGHVVIHSKDQVKKVEVKPYIEVNLCDSCSEVLTGTFCGDCLSYCCVVCWQQQHSWPSLALHRPVGRGNTLTATSRGRSRFFPSMTGPSQLRPGQPAFDLFRNDAISHQPGQDDWQPLPAPHIRRLQGITVPFDDVMEANFNATASHGDASRAPTATLAQASRAGSFGPIWPTANFWC